MHEEDLIHYFKHARDSASADLGSYTMVAAAHDDSFEANAQTNIAYTQPGATCNQTACAVGAPSCCKPMRRK
jgi:hypothetical protein